MITHLDALVLGQQAEMRAMPYSGRRKGGAAEGRAHGGGGMEDGQGHGPIYV